MVDENKLKKLDEIFSKAIEMSNAHIEKKIIIPYDPIIPDKETEAHNPVGKNFHIEFYGCKKEIMQASSGIFALTESDGSFHLTPETNPNFMEFGLRTCGNLTHPINCLKYLLEECEPEAGRMFYLKRGWDIAKRKSGFPKTIEDMVKKYNNQFYTSKYRFDVEGLIRFGYFFSFYDPSRLTQKIAKELEIDWPLTTEAQKLGVFREGKDMILPYKNGNGNGSSEKK